MVSWIFFPCFCLPVNDLVLVSFFWRGHLLGVWTQEINFWSQNQTANSWAFDHKANLLIPSWDDKKLVYLEHTKRSSLNRISTALEPTTWLCLSNDLKAIYTRAPSCDKKHNTRFKSKFYLLTFIKIKLNYLLYSENQISHCPQEMDSVVHWASPHNSHLIHFH